MAPAVTTRPPSAEQPASNRATYARMLQNAELAGVPGRVKSDSDGNLVVSPPPSRRHSYRQSRILTLLTKLLPDGTALAEYPVSTPAGVKGADVVWLAPGREVVPSGDALDERAPELGVQVLSPASSGR